MHNSSTAKSYTCSPHTFCICHPIPIEPNLLQSAPFTYSSGLITNIITLWELYSTHLRYNHHPHPITTTSRWASTNPTILNGGKSAMHRGGSAPSIQAGPGTMRFYSGYSSVYIERPGLWTNELFSNLLGYYLNTLTQYFFQSNSTIIITFSTQKSLG